ncbi:MAG: hypothetical protein ACI9LG_001721 [Moritella dasanensis]|jgi:hypothetical protein
MKMKYQTALIAIVTYYLDGEVPAKENNVIAVMLAIKHSAP